MKKPMKSSVNKNTLVIASQELVSTELSTDSTGSVVILSLKDGIYYELKEVAAYIWKLIQKPQPVPIDKVIESISNEYEVDAERCEADLVILVEDLAKKGLIEIQEKPEP